MDHNKLKHGRPGSDPPTPPPAAKRRLDTVEVSALQKQIAALADQLAKQAEEITRLQRAVSDLTEAQTHKIQPPTTAPPNMPAQNNNEQSKGNPEPACLAPSAQPKHAPHQQKACRPPRLWKNHTPPLNPLHRNSTRRLIIDTPIPQDNHRIGRAVVEDINNRLLEKTKDEKICVDAVLYSRTGRPVIIAAMTTDAEALLPHRHLIMETITGRQGKTRAYVDRPQFRVKLNGVPTKDPAGKPLTAAVVLNYISGIWARYNDMEINWKLDHQPSWITPPEELAKKSHSTIVIPFNDKETATKFYRYKDFLVFGERCRTSLYTDHPPKNRSIHKQDEHPPRPPLQIPKPPQCNSSPLLQPMPRVNPPDLPHPL